MFSGIVILPVVEGLLPWIPSVVTPVNPLPSPFKCPKDPVFPYTFPLALISPLAEIYPNELVLVWPASKPHY